MTSIKPIHPFPARMAPEIALAESGALPKGSIVLDPMIGSGTALRVALANGHKGIGFDMDPLAVLISRVWLTPLNTNDVRLAARHVVTKALALGDSSPSLPWIENDPETQSFVDYWFGKTQQWDLRKLGWILYEMDDAVGDALRVALSKTIVTKDSGASLARDVSHSRPHRVRSNNDYDVIGGFLSAVNRLCRCLEDDPPQGGASVRFGDARYLVDVPTATVDAVITSPPYLNAIDYLRGHRLALVWLGYGLKELRTIRANSIGNERMSEPDADEVLARELLSSQGCMDRLPSRERRMVYRYMLDMHAVSQELHRVVRPTGTVVLVVGNSCIKGVFVRNDVALESAFRGAGFHLRRRHERELPTSRRYLPPPSRHDASTLEKRMRAEVVLTFVKE